MRFPFRSKPALQCLRGHVSSFSPRAWTSFYPETSALQYISLPIFIEKVQLSALQEKLGKSPWAAIVQEYF